MYTHKHLTNAEKKFIKAYCDMLVYIRQYSANEIIRYCSSIEHEISQLLQNFDITHESNVEVCVLQFANSIKGNDNVQLQ